MRNRKRGIQTAKKEGETRSKERGNCNKDMLYEKII